MGHLVAKWPCLTRHLTVGCGMVNFLDQDGRSNLARPLRFGQGIKAPCWLQFALKMYPVNEAAAPSPGRIWPETATRRSKMVLWWGVHGGFVLSHQEASLESMGGWWWGAPYCKWIRCVCSLFLPVVDVCVCSFLRYAPSLVKIDFVLAKIAVTYWVVWEPWYYSRYSKISAIKHRGEGVCCTKRINGRCFSVIFLFWI